MRSWLSNPVVAFIGFLASLITVAEYVVFVARRVAKHGHSYIWVALVSLTVVVAISPLEWSAM